MSYEDCISDADCDREYYRNIRETNKRAGNQRYDCPTCGRKRALSAHQHQQGYQCDHCADLEEGVG